MTAQQRTMRDIWTATKGYLQLMVTKSVWETYIQTLQPVAWQNNVLTMAAPNIYVRDWCAIRLNRIIQRELRLEANRPDLTVVYILQETVHAQ